MNMRTANIVGGVGILLFLFCGGAIVLPVFASAKVAAEQARQHEEGRRLFRALAKYVEAHQGRLPGTDWRAQIERYDPGIFSQIDREFDGRMIGYAPLPHVLGKKLDSFEPDTIIFVQYHASSPLAGVDDPAEFGPGGRSGRAAFIQADGAVRQYSPESIMRRLIKQGSFSAKAR